MSMRVSYLVLVLLGASGLSFVESEDVRRRGNEHWRYQSDGLEEDYLEGNINQKLPGKWRKNGEALEPKWRDGDSMPLVPFPVSEIARTVESLEFQPKRLVPFARFRGGDDRKHLERLPDEEMHKTIYREAFQNSPNEYDVDDEEYQRPRPRKRRPPQMHEFTETRVSYPTFQIDIGSRGVTKNSSHRKAEAGKENSELKSLLKMQRDEGLTSLSEVLQRRNLTLIDLLKGKADIASVLKDDEETTLQPISTPLRPGNTDRTEREEVDAVTETPATAISISTTTAISGNETGPEIVPDEDEIMEFSDFGMEKPKTPKPTEPTSSGSDETTTNIPGELFSSVETTTGATISAVTLPPSTKFTGRTVEELQKFETGSTLSIEHLLSGVTEMILDPTTMMSTTTMIPSDDEGPSVPEQTGNSLYEYENGQVFDMLEYQSDEGVPEPTTESKEEGEEEEKKKKKEMEVDLLSNHRLSWDSRAPEDAQARAEIFELFASGSSAARLEKLLQERNMSLDELIALRQRGSSKVHFAEVARARERGFSRRRKPEPTTNGIGFEGPEEFMGNSKPRIATTTMMTATSPPVTTETNLQGDYDQEEVKTSTELPDLFVNYPNDLENSTDFIRSGFVEEIEEAKEAVEAVFNENDRSEERKALSRVKPTIIASGAILGVTIVVFLAIFVTCRIKQKQKYTYRNTFSKAVFQGPVLAARKLSNSSSLNTIMVNVVATSTNRRPDQGEMRETTDDFDYESRSEIDNDSLDANDSWETIPDYMKSRELR